MEGSKRKLLIRWGFPIAVALLILGVMLIANRQESRVFPMQGVNLADLQPSEIIRNVAQVTGAAEEEIYADTIGRTMTWHVTGDFDWDISAGFAMITSRDTWFGQSRSYYRQLRVFPQQEEFFITASQRLSYVPDAGFRLADILYGLRYIPQSHIQYLVQDDPCTYIINVGGSEIPNNGQPHIFYNRNGVIESSTVQGNFIRFDIIPIYQGQGVGEDLIHVFFEIC